MRNVNKLTALLSVLVAGCGAVEHRDDDGDDSRVHIEITGSGVAFELGELTLSYEDGTTLSREFSAGDHSIDDVPAGPALVELELVAQGHRAGRGSAFTVVSADTPIHIELGRQAQRFAGGTVIGPIAASEGSQVTLEVRLDSGLATGEIRGTGALTDLVPSIALTPCGPMSVCGTVDVFWLDRGELEVVVAGELIAFPIHGRWSARSEARAQAFTSFVGVNADGSIMALVTSPELLEAMSLSSGQLAVGNTLFAMINETDPEFRTLDPAIALDRIAGALAMVVMHPSALVGDTQGHYAFALSGGVFSKMVDALRRGTLIAGCSAVFAGPAQCGAAERQAAERALKMILDSFERLEDDLWDQIERAHAAGDLALELRLSIAIGGLRAIDIELYKMWLALL